MMKVYLGIDVGSVTTKIALVDKNGQHVDSYMTRTAGQPVIAVQKCLDNLLSQANGREYEISAVGTTGSGRNLAGALVGAVAMACCTFIPVSTLKKFAVPTYLFSLVLLALVFVPGIGIENYGAKRWIGFGGFSLQPSEIAKFALVLVCSLYMSKNPSQMSGFKGIAIVSLLGIAVCVLVILEPNMSITMCVALVTFAMLFVGGVKIKHVVLCLLPLVVAVPLLIVAEPYRLARLMAYLDPWASPKGEGYQLIQSFYALGSGGWFGVGFFNSRQKFDFLPFAESDFIFAVIGE